LCARILRFLEAVLATLVVAAAAVLVSKLIDNQSTQHWLYTGILYYVYLLVYLLIVIGVEAAFPVDVHLIVRLLAGILKQLVGLLKYIEWIEVVVAHVERRVQNLVQQILLFDQELLLLQLLQQQLLLLLLRLLLVVAILADLLVAAGNVQIIHLEEVAATSAVDDCILHVLGVEAGGVGACSSELRSRLHIGLKRVQVVNLL